MIKNLPANEGDIRDLGLIPGSRRSPGGGHGNPLQYSCLENPMDRAAWRATICRVAKSQSWLKWLSLHAWKLRTKQSKRSGHSWEIDHLGGALLGVYVLKDMEKDEKIQLRTYTLVIDPNQVWFSNHLQWRTVYVFIPGQTYLGSYCVMVGRVHMHSYQVWLTRLNFDRLQSGLYSGRIH